MPSPKQGHPTSRTTPAAAVVGQFFFDQLIDHATPSLGTFKQRYFFSDQYYAGQGSPIVISTPGEQSADSFDTDLSGPSLQNAVMQVFEAAGVILEHRYWGQSSPYTNLTVQNLRYLQVGQAIDDFKYFVENVQLSWTGSDSQPSVTPWVNLGCSYPGLLVAYTQEQYPDLFAAAWASSAPVHAEGDFWQYFQPIEQGMPKNCSADVATLVAHMDQIMTSGTPENITSLKAQFGLEALANDDFASALTLPLHAWQNQQPPDFALRGGEEDVFFQWCDALECAAAGQCNPSATGVGLPALSRWARWFKSTYVPDAGGACFSTYAYDSPAYTDTSLANAVNRAWMWLTCTELGYFQDGDPGNATSIVSRWITPASNARRCDNMFPTASGAPGNYTPSAPTESKGWTAPSPNTFFVNGEFDPWRSASLTTTTTDSIAVIPGARHCWDQSMVNAQINADVLAAQTQGIIRIRGWLEDWYAASRAGGNVTDMAMQVGRAGGKPLTELIDMGVLSSSSSAGALDAGSSLTGGGMGPSGWTALQLASLAANVVFGLTIVALGVLLFRARRVGGRRSKAYEMVGGSSVQSLGYKDAMGGGEALGEFALGRTSGAGGGGGTYRKVENAQYDP